MRAAQICGLLINPGEGRHPKRLRMPSPAISLRASHELSQLVFRDVVPNPFTKTPIAFQISCLIYSS